jgi:hypothetical protein
MPTSLHIRIHANGNSGSRTASTHATRRFIEQNIQFRFGFNIEEQNSTLICASGFTSSTSRASRRRSIAQRLAYLFARFPHAGKNDAVAAHADAA